MAVSRITIVKNKKTNAVKNQRREIASLLSQGKEEKCRIRVEGVIREDFTIEAYEILELLCELLAERCALISAEKECPYDMREAVSTLIYAADRTEIPELREVKKQLKKKYGQDFTLAAEKNINGCVNERVIQRLSIQPPNAMLVHKYMKQIAHQHNVHWTPDNEDTIDETKPAAAPTGTSVQAASASGPDYAALYANDPIRNTIPSAMPSLPDASEPSAPQHHKPRSSDQDVPNFDELAQRFENLRRKS